MIKYLLLGLPLVMYGATADMAEENLKGIAVSRSAFKTPPKKKVMLLPISPHLPKPEIEYGGRWAYLVPRTQLLLKGYDGSPSTKLKRHEANEEVIDGE